ncbi:MAG: hypothetical protein ACYTG0_04825 [Planctomycetota bacterium]
MRSKEAEPWPEPVRPSIDELTEACRQAKTAFSPRTEAHLQAAKEDLLAAADRLDARLAAAGRVGESWREFLDWSVLQQELNRDPSPDLKTLAALQRKYESGHAGLGLIWFADVRHALKRYLTTALAIDNADLETVYETFLDALPESVVAYHDDPTPEAAHEIAGSVEWLERYGQAPELTDAIRRYYSHPNLLLEVSGRLIDARLSMPVDEAEPVRDVILGADICGTGHMQGRVSAELIPNPRHAAIQTVLRGTIDSQTVGSKGPARVYSDSLTEITCRKPLVVDAEQVATAPARSRAVTRTKITGVRTVRGGQFVQQLVRRRANSQKGKAQAVAARHAEQRINRRVDEQVEELVDEANAVFRKRFRRPLLERKLFPQLFRFSTSETAIHLTSLFGGSSGLGASISPPKVESDHDLTVRLHESTINNLTATLLTGMIVEEERLQAELSDLLDETPEWLQPDEESEPWGITFPRDKAPVSVRFDEGRFSVTLRGRRYAKGGEQYPGMNVTAVYAIQKTDQGFKAARQGELEIFPPGFKPGEGARLSARQQVLRTLLEKRFGKIFSEQFDLNNVVLPDEWRDGGELALSHWTASGGWMVLAWTRVPPAEEASVARLTASIAP